MLKSIAPEHFRGSRGQATRLTACPSAGFASAWRGEPRTRARDPAAPDVRTAKTPAGVKTVAPRHATRAAHHGRFQNLKALLWFTRAAVVLAGRHMSQAASGRRGPRFCSAKAKAKTSWINDVPLYVRTTEHKLRLHNTVSVLQPLRSCQPKRHAACNAPWRSASTRTTTTHACTLTRRRTTAW